MLYRFGDCLVDTDRFELMRDGQPLHVEPRVFAVLVYLLEHRDRLVPKHELLDRVWKTQFVTESALTSQIKAARRAIGDQGRTQDLIRTVRGQGYRFVAEVQEAPRREPDSSAPATDAQSSPGLPTEDPQPAPRKDVSLPRFDDVLRGRERELVEVDALVSGHRVVTLLGPGGAGKTRLAVEVARRRDGELPAVFVDLAAARSAAAAPGQLAAALGIQLGQRDDVLTACCEYLSAIPHRLVVDNCEHVIGAASEVVTGVAERSTRSEVLCTSRSPLGMPDEQLYRVGSLPTVPADGPVVAETVRASASGALFADRARRGDHRFSIDDGNASSVAALCRALDGLPLAIELAAGRLTALSIDDLLARLDRRLDLLDQGPRAAVPRHRTLRALVTWSYDTLDAESQRLLRCLAVLPAGATLETIEAMGRDLALSDDPLAVVTSLVDASLLQLTGTAHGARYVQLETIRAFGLDQLERHDDRARADAVAAGRMLDLVRRMDGELLTEAEPRWSNRIEVELPNLRMAHEHLMAEGRLADVVDLLAHLHEWCRLRGVSEPWSWAEDVLAAVGSEGPLSARPHAFAALGAWRRGEFARCRALAERSLELAEAHDDAWCRARALSEMAVGALFAGETALAVESWLARFSLDGYPGDLANAGFATAYAGDVERARQLVAEARDLAERSGAPSSIAWTCYATGEVEHVAGAGREIPWLARAIELADAANAPFTRGVAEVTLASALAATGDVAGAASSYHHLVEHWLRSGSWTQQWTTLRNAAALLEPAAPETALAIVCGAELDPFSPALGDAAREECERLRGRLTRALGTARSAAIAEAAATLPRVELAGHARDALAGLAAPPVG